MPPRGRQPKSKGAAPAKVRPDHRASSRGPTGRSPADVQLRPRSVLNRAVPTPRPLSGPVTVAAPARAPPPSSSSSSSPRPRPISPPLAHGPTTSSGSRDEPDRNDFSFPPNPDVFVSINPPENPSDSLEPGDPSEERPRRPREVEDVLVKPGRRVREITGQETKKGRQIRRSRSRPRGPGLLMMLARINRTLEPVCARIARGAQLVVVAPILLYVLTWLWLLAQEMSIFGVGPTVERIGAAVCETGMREVLPTTSCDSFQARPMMLPGLNTTDAFGATSRKELLMSFASLELDAAVLGSMKQDVEGLTGAAAARLNLALATFDASRSLADEGLRAWLHSPPSRELTRLWKGWAARSMRAGEQGRRAAAGLHHVFPPALSVAPSGFMLLQILPALEQEVREFVGPLETRLPSAIAAAEALIGQANAMDGFQGGVAKDVGVKTEQLTRTLGVALETVRGLAETLREHVAILEMFARCPHLVSLPEWDRVFGGPFVDVTQVLDWQESMAAAVNVAAEAEL